jgi:hypothetical protein
MGRSHARRRKFWRSLKLGKGNAGAVATAQATMSVAEVARKFNEC